MIFEIRAKQISKFSITLVSAILFSLSSTVFPSQPAHSTNFLQCVAFKSSKMVQSPQFDVITGSIVYLEFYVVLRDSCNMPQKVAWYFDEYSMTMSLPGEPGGFTLPPQRIVGLSPDGTEYYFKILMVKPGVKYPQITLNANGFLGSYETKTIDLPTFSLKVKTSKKSSSKKKTTITCVKGQTVKKITATNPKCPNGFRKKKLDKK